MYDVSNLILLLQKFVSDFGKVHTPLVWKIDYFFALDHTLVWFDGRDTTTNNSSHLIEARKITKGYHMDVTT